MYFYILFSEVKLDEVFYINDKAYTKVSRNKGRLNKESIKVKDHELVEVYYDNL